MKIILASASPRRREILKKAGLKFSVKTADVDETLPDGISPANAVRYLCRIKNEAIKADENTVVITADTVVACEGKILGKPETKKQAREMLTLLSGREHSVYTGVCIRKGKKKKIFTDRTRVYFYDLSKKEIDAYIETGEPMDKAGAYGIQGGAGVFVKKINGDYYNVVGLPLARLVRELKEFE
jgi:septum formation protein